MDIEIEIARLRAKVLESKNLLKIYKSSTLDHISDWIGNVKNIKGFSKTTISIALNKNLEEIDVKQHPLEGIKNKLIELDTLIIEMVGDMKKKGYNPYQNSSLLIPKSPPTYLTRERSFTQSWIKQQLLTYKKEKVEVEVTAMGINLSSLNMALNTLMNDDNLPTIDAKLLILEVGSIGSELRAIFENRDKQAYLDVLSHSQGHMKLLEKFIKRYDSKSALEIRTFHFNPMSYMIRINNTMLVGTYFVKRGHLTPCNILTEEEFPNQFNNYLNDFSTIYNSDKLSKLF